MKIILTGATGFVGGVLLKFCIAHPAITSIVVLSRRELDESQTCGDNEQSNGGKVKVILHQDFESYPDELLKELEGAEGCLW
jgi:NAD dependent epimerase/dehydratase family enzyme